MVHLQIKYELSFAVFMRENYIKRYSVYRKRTQKIMTTYPTIMPSGALGNSAGKGAEQQVFRNGNHYILLYGNIIRLIYLFGSRMSGVQVPSLRPY